VSHSVCGLAGGCGNGLVCTHGGLTFLMIMKFLARSFKQPMSEATYLTA
jgi:acyl dehydratase